MVVFHPLNMHSLEIKSYCYKKVHKSKLQPDKFSKWKHTPPTCTQIKKTITSMPEVPLISLQWFVTISSAQPESWTSNTINWFCLFLKFYIRRIMQHIPFCVWYFVKLGRFTTIFALIVVYLFSVKFGIYYMNIPQFSQSFIEHLSCLLVWGC